MEDIRYEVRIEGASPLLMNKFIQSDLTDMKLKRGESKEKDPNDKLYLTHDGLLFTPSSHIRGSLIEAGKAVQIAGKRRATYSKVIGASVTVMPDEIIHKHQRWEPFTITAVNPATRGRMVVTRPKLDKWALEFEITAPEDIPEDKLNAILVEAGQHVGIGDWRPQKKGMYGKFIVAKFKRVS